MPSNRGAFHINHFLQPPTTELSHFLVGDNQLTICNGCNASYKKGALIKDLGYSKIGSTIQASKSITSLYNFRQSSSVQKILATVNNSTGVDLELYYSTGGAWTEIPAAQVAWAGFEDCLVEMESFIGYCFFVGYDAADNVFLPVGSLTGTTFSTATNVTSMPGAKYVKRYRDRIYVANCYNGGAQPYRVYFSSVPTAGAITWTTASDFFDVDYSEEITGIEQNWDRLIVFTEFSAYMYNQSEKKKVWDTGCANQRSIQNISSYMIWGTKDNIFVSTGGQPAPIGNDILELIRRSNSAVWRSAIVDGEYVLYLGDTQANGIAYTNCVATYNIDTGMWRWRELKDTVTSLARYTSSGTDFLLLGCNDGDVHKKSKYTDATQITKDDGSSIVSHFRTKAYDLGDPSIMKKLQKIVAYAERGNGLQLSYRLFNDKQEALQKFKPIGTLDRVVNVFSEGMEGYFIQFEGRELSGNAPWIFNGLSVLITPDNRL